MFFAINPKSLLSTLLSTFFPMSNSMKSKTGMVYFENLSKSIIFSENSFILLVNFSIPTTVKLKSEKLISFL